MPYDDRSSPSTQRTTVTADNSWKRHIDHRTRSTLVAQMKNGDKYERGVAIERLQYAGACDLVDEVITILDERSDAIVGAKALNYLAICADAIDLVDRVEPFLRGVAWDIGDELRIAAIGLVGHMLIQRPESYSSLAGLLIDLARSGEQSKLIRELAMETINDVMEAVEDRSSPSADDNLKASGPSAILDRAATRWGRGGKLSDSRLESLSALLRSTDPNERALAIDELRDALACDLHSEVLGALGTERFPDVLESGLRYIAVCHGDTKGERELVETFLNLDEETGLTGDSVRLAAITAAGAILLDAHATGFIPKHLMAIASCESIARNLRAAATMALRKALEYQGVYPWPEGDDTPESLRTADVLMFSAMRWN